MVMGTGKGTDPDTVDDEFAIHADDDDANIITGCRFTLCQPTPHLRTPQLSPPMASTMSFSLRTSSETLLTVQHNTTSCQQKRQ